MQSGLLTVRIDIQSVGGFSTALSIPKYCWVGLIFATTPDLARIAVSVSLSFAE